MVTNKHEICLKQEFLNCLEQEPQVSVTAFEGMRKTKGGKCLFAYSQFSSTRTLPLHQDLWQILLAFILFLLYGDCY